MNLYTELVESGQGRSRYAMYGTPGRKLFTTLPDYPIRCLWAGDHRLFAVAGGSFLEVFQDGTSHLIGTVAPGTTPAQIFADAATPGTQVFITSAGQGYRSDGTGVFPVVAAATGTFLDGYFIAAQPNSKQFNISGINDPSSWNPLDFGIKQGWLSDNLSAVWMDHKLLWLFGFETTEVWYDSGNANFPFTPIQSGGFIQHGCTAPFSPAQVGESIMYLAGDMEGGNWVAQTQGLVPNRVSNHAMEFALSNYSETQDAVGYGYQDAGLHFFYYVLHFPIRQTRRGCTIWSPGNGTSGDCGIPRRASTTWTSRRFSTPMVHGRPTRRRGIHFTYDARAKRKHLHPEQ